MQKSFLLTLREAAKVQTNVDLAYGLRSAADMLDRAIVHFAHDATTENLIDVNGAWAYAVRVLKVAQDPPQPTPPIQERQDVEPVRKAA